MGESLRCARLEWRRAYYKGSADGKQRFVSQGVVTSLDLY
jgi:hypothetical protein